ncbi:SOS response-associated peptidase [Azospirillum cavernae]|uniref:Abasic site processing protein n=2 Tax=Azospirillum cavernae TaxID=2320860 RepID=A0A418W1K5_9PROT|nr:SOS response-associated peptidase [Azospirillum cavernae]
MCGRMMLTSPVSAIERIFGVPERPNLKPRWNIAPTQEIPVIRKDKDRRRLALPRWGLVPSWAEDPSIGARMINARAESAAEKPAFREAFRLRRCLVPVDGFYEWAEVDGRKQGRIIRRRDRALFALAGLWESWRGPKGGPELDPPLETPPLETATVLTTSANAALSVLHDRMPVILDEGDWAAWFDPETPLSDLATLLRPAPDDLLDLTPVGPRVNSVRNDDPGCLDPPPEPVRKPADDQFSLF